MWYSYISQQYTLQMQENSGALVDTLDIHTISTVTRSGTLLVVPLIKSWELIPISHGPSLILYLI